MKRFETPNVLPYILVLGIVLLRLEPSHLHNFIPVFACLLFLAAMRPAKDFVLPLLALIGVDIFLTIHKYGYPLTIGAAVTWIWYGVVLMLGAGLLRNSRTMRRVAGTSMLASISFFLTSNFTVWAEWSMYPKTLGGLGSCYIAALPFFRNSLGSELVCSLLIFGLSSYATLFVQQSSAVAVGNCS